MYKLVLPPAAPRSARIADQPEEIVTNVASALGKPVAQMRIVVLDKPRHAQLELEDLVGADGAFIATGVTGTPTKE